MSYSHDMARQFTLAQLRHKLDAALGLSQRPYSVGWKKTRQLVRAIEIRIENQWS